MNVNTDLIDRTQFYVNEHVLNGETVYLVQPRNIGIKWTRDTKVFRSSVWTARGDLISAGFPKFTNWGEAPDVFPLPTTLTGATIMEKIDGSLLIVSKWKGEYILRTRGTVDATKLDNGFELEIFKQTILPKLAEYDKADMWDYSYLFEWTSPLQKIILTYGEQPQWFLVGGVNHKNYDIWEQHYLDKYAADWELKRPLVYTFDTIEDLLANVEKWQGREGVCVYSGPTQQSIHKAKSAWYLALHHMKSEFNTFEKIVDFWYSCGSPDYTTFAEKITAIDFEIWNQCRGDVSKMFDGFKEVTKIVDHMKKFVKEELSKYPTRKLQAVVTFQSYGKGSNRSSFVFKLLDGRELDSEDYKKLLFQVTK